MEAGWWQTFTVMIRRDTGMEIKPEAEQIDGKTYLFRFVGTQGDEEKYPGEDMWMPDDAAYPNDGPTWIASGDLVHNAK